MGKKVYVKGCLGTAYEAEVVDIFTNDDGKEVLIVKYKGMHNAVMEQDIAKESEIIKYKRIAELEAQIVIARKELKELK